MIAQLVYDVPSVVILNSCVRAITAWDLITSMIKAWVFGAIISIVSPPCRLLLMKCLRMVAVARPHHACSQSHVMLDIECLVASQA